MGRTKTAPEARLEAAAADHSGQFRDAEGDGVPEAPGRATSATAHAALEAGQVTGGSEKHPNPPESASETTAAGPESPWSRAGVPPEALVWPVTAPRKNRLRGFLGRLRGPDSGKAPKIPENRPGVAAPVNLRPWTWERLPHVSETRDGSPLTRLMDRIAWHATLPDDRYVLHAERIARRKESLVARALVRFAAACAGKAGGAPSWLGDERRGERR